MERAVFYAYFASADIWPDRSRSLMPSEVARDVRARDPPPSPSPYTEPHPLRHPQPATSSL